MATLLRSTSDGTRRMLWRFYRSKAARRSALTQLVHRGGWNYFVLYQDVRGPALNVGYADWAAPDIYVDW